MAPSKFVGVDGYHKGWFSVGFDPNGEYELEVFPAFDQLLAHYGDASLVLVDIPIGLPQDKKSRKCDKEARKRIGGRRSNGFPTPMRQTVEHAAQSPNDYRGAVYVEQRFAGKEISEQAFAMAPKIAEVNEILLCRGTNATPTVREVHPELCFWALKKGKPLESKKKKKKGRRERLRVLQRTEIRTDEIFREARSKFPKEDVARDDILSALAAAVTAYLGHDRLETVPKDPPKDSKGLPMEMVYWKVAKAKS